MHFKYSCFISYRRIEWCIKCAVLFKKLLNENEETHGFQVFLDDDNIETGVDIPEKVVNGIYESMSLLFLVVPVSIRETNPHCAWELSHFSEYEKLRVEKLKKEKPGISEDDCKRQIIPILIKGTKDDLPPMLKDRKYIDFRSQMLSLNKNSKVVKDTCKKIIASFDSLREIFKDFDNVEKIQAPPLDFKLNIEKIGYIAPFPSIIMNKKNDN